VDVGEIHSSVAPIIRGGSDAAGKAGMAPSVGAVPRLVRPSDWSDNVPEHGQ